MITNLE
jgi:hypothetical protein